jgi:uncharacterized cupredoxin-like copper-binding protein
MAALAVACGGGDDDASSSGAAAAPAATQAAAAATQAAAANDQQEGAVAVTLTEWAVAVNEGRASAGDVTFAVSNGGGVPHELAVVRADAAADALPTAAGVVDEAQVELIGRTGQIGGGGSEDVTFSLAAGSYVLICNIPAHYDLGMRIGFTVE